jgi:hypothetical protein
MLEFNADNMEDLELECQERADEVGLATVKAVCSALKAEVDVVNVGYMKNLGMEITCERSGFLEALTMNIKRCEALEEYELCAEARKWIKILNNEQK